MLSRTYTFFSTLHFQFSNNKLGLVSWKHHKDHNAALCNALSGIFGILSCWTTRGQPWTFCATSAFGCEPWSSFSVVQYVRICFLFLWTLLVAFFIIKKIFYLHLPLASIRNTLFNHLTIFVFQCHFYSFFVS